MRWLQFILSHSIFISICAAALCYQTFELLHIPFNYFIYGLVFYVFKYRRDTVHANLALAFPEKTAKERAAIAKKFYHNLIDTFLESLKFISIFYGLGISPYTGKFSPTQFKNFLFLGSSIGLPQWNSVSWFCC